MRATTYLSIEEIIRNIENKQHFEAFASDGSFQIKINKYVPFCCIAVHSGSRLRKNLQEIIVHNDYQRWYEEDPYTGDFIVSLPITIIGNDSRYEYDLNRSPEECVYDVAWGKKVWKKSLTAQEIRTSKLKHANYYKVFHALIAKLEHEFGSCVVYDMHSYNHKRWEKQVPVFNVGTENVATEKYGDAINHWVMELQQIELPDMENSCAINNAFYGRGYNAVYVKQHFKNTLVLATDIKKIYIDELTGDAYPKVIRTLQQRLKKAIINNANFFSQKLEKWHHISSVNLLDKTMDENLLKTDKYLYTLLRNFELLAAVNPVNTAAEKRKFLKLNGTTLPQFKYNPVKVNAFALKEKLLSLPVQRINDISIRNMYEAVINSYFDKIDMTRTLGTSKFLYNSLRYFGRPSKKDLLNASYLLHLPDIPGEATREPLYNVEEAKEIFQQALNEYGITAKIEVSNKVISHVMVLNSKKSILFQPKAEFRNKELKALIEHEIGVHMVTTSNANLQPLHIFNIGLPVNTLTQEGLAVLAEYLSGNITLRRLKKLAVRVVAVDAMCSGADFIDCFNLLVYDYHLEREDAFNVVTRIFRGGGFTKDYLYLSGFVKILRMWEQQQDLTPLLVGKTSLSFYNTIDEMIGREMIVPPNFITRSFVQPETEQNNTIYNYILSGLK